MMILIDGMLVHRMSYSDVPWQTLPVNIQDIERIEVTRSPSNALYGINSSEAAVNIITRHPTEAQGTNIEVFAGELNTRNFYVSHGDQIGEADIVIAASDRFNTGYDETQNSGQDRRDNTDVATAYIRGSTQLGDSLLDFQISLVNSELGHQNSDSGAITPTDSNEKDQYININYKIPVSDKHEMKVHLDLISADHKEEWATCHPALLFNQNLRSLYLQNSTYANTIIAGGIPSGGTAADDLLAGAVINDINLLGGLAGASSLVCGNVNENYKSTRSHLTFEDTYIFSNTLRTVNGIGMYVNQTVSDTFLAGEFQNEIYHLFSNWEYKIADFVINFGAIAKKETETAGGSFVSTHIAANYRITQNDTLRATYSKSYRTPNVFENNANWSYYMTDINPTVLGNNEAYFIYNSQARGDLDKEEMVSSEVGYYGEFPSINARLDIKLFYHDLKKLITQDILFYDYDLDNSNSASRKGGEIEIHMRFTEDVQFSLGYSRLQCDGTHTYVDDSLCAENSGFSNITYIINPTLEVSAAYYASSNLSGFPYHRTDLILQKHFRQDNYTMGASLVLRMYSDNLGFTYNQLLNTYENNYENNNQLFGELSVSF